MNETLQNSLFVFPIPKHSFSKCLFTESNTSIYLKLVTLLYYAYIK